MTTIPGVGAIAARALTTLGPPRGAFAKGRDVVAWAGLPPRQRSSGGKGRPGKASKMGQRDIPRPLTIGAVALAQWILGRIVAGAGDGANPRASSQSL